MKKAILLLSLLTSGATLVNAQLLDQSNNSPLFILWTVDYGPNVNVAQSFTAGMNGTLNKVVISLNHVYTDGTFSLVIRSGDGYGGAILGTEFFTLTTTTPTGSVEIPISGSINMVSGNQYTFIIAETSGTGEVVFTGTDNNYGGGIAYETVLYTVEIGYPDKDLWFQTYVDVPDSYATFDITSCGDYVSPSGNYTWTTSGTYNDTIPNTVGTDSIMTFNMDIISIMDQTVNATSTTLCPGESTDIEVASSENGLNYYLRNNSDNSIVAGPLAGDGGALTFNTGSLTSSSTFNVLAERNTGSLILPATDDKVQFNSPYYTFGDEITIEAYVFSDGTEHVWAGQGTLNSDLMTTNVWLWHNGSFLVNNAGTWRSATMPSLPSGWTHIATVSKPDCMLVYYDGVLVGWDSTFNAGAVQNNSGSSIVLGQDPRYMNDPLRNSDVGFDNFIVWNEARTPSEIQNDMISCPSLPDFNLQLFAKFNAGSGTYVSTEAGPSGTIINGTSNWTIGAGVCDMVCDLQMTDLVNIVINTVDASVTKSGFTLTANANPATYQWLDCNNAMAEITGETNQNFTATTDGSYAAAITAGGCTDTSACQVLSSAGIGQSELSTVTIFPNPGNGNFSINLGDQYDQVAYTLSTAEGRIVTKDQLQHVTTFSVDLTNEPKGIYLMTLVTGDAVQTFRLITQ